MLLGRLRGSVSCQVLFSTPSRQSMGEIPREKKLAFWKKGSNLLCKRSLPAVRGLSCGKPLWKTLWRMWKSFCFPHPEQFFPQQCLSIFLWKNALSPLAFSSFSREKNRVQFCLPYPFSEEKSWRIWPMPPESFPFVSLRKIIFVKIRQNPAGIIFFRREILLAPHQGGFLCRERLRFAV